MNIDALVQELILLFNLTNQIKLSIESIEIMDENGNKIIII
jgi:hypothetical protein